MNDTERFNFIASITRCDPKMDGNHVFLIGGRCIKGFDLRDAIDKELIRLYGKAEMPKGEK